MAKKEKKFPILKSLHIHRNYSEELMGTIEFKTSHGEVKLDIPEEKVHRLIITVGDLLVEDTQEIATAMNLEAAEALQLLEAPEEPMEGEVI